MRLHAIPLFQIMPINYTQLSHDLAALCRTTAGFIRQEAATFDRATVEHKGLHDLVSYVDQETERRLVAGLRQLLPEAGFINQRGEITQREPAWIPTTSRATVHLNNEVTFYARYGELIGRGAQLLAVLLLGFAIVRGWQSKRQRTTGHMA